jgi:hypothetical protein
VTDIQYAECIEACGRARWHLEAAGAKLLAPCNAAIFMDGATPDHVLNTVTTAMIEVDALVKQFTQAQKGAA